MLNSQGKKKNYYSETRTTRITWAASRKLADRRQGAHVHRRFLNKDPELQHLVHKVE